MNCDPSKPVLNLIFFNFQKKWCCLRIFVGGSDFYMYQHLPALSHKIDRKMIWVLRIYRIRLKLINDCLMENEVFLQKSLLILLKRVLNVYPKCTRRNKDFIIKLFNLNTFTIHVLLELLNITIMKYFHFQAIAVITFRIRSRH